MADPIIRFQGIQKAFGPTRVYDDLTLDIFSGETLTVIGGSGVGKSVLLKLLIRLLDADGGEIQAFGENVGALDAKGLIRLRTRIAMLFQGGALFDSLSVADNIKYPLVEHHWGSTVEMDRRVSEVLDMVDLPGVEQMHPAQLSGGMRKRVGLARAIAIKPEVILYDEPTTGLDPLNVRRINGLILSLQERLGVTSIVVTHDMDSAFTVTNRLAMIRDRRIAFVGSIEQARASDLSYLRAFMAGGRGTLDDTPDLSEANTDPGIEPPG